MDIQELLPELVKIARDAGRFLLKYRQKHGGRINEIKSKKDFLTNADLESDRLISEQLKCLTPEVPIYSEENALLLTGQKEFWVVDPLDGTINYSNGDCFWGVSIALVENKQSQLGVVYLPALNRLAAVSRNGKTIVEGCKLAVSTETELNKAQVWIDWPKILPAIKFKNSRKIILSLLDKLAEKTFYPQIRLCCSASLMAVAIGQISGYIHPQPGIEDFSAGCLIVEKAGGQVTDLNGKPWNLDSRSIVASNGLIHKKLFTEIIDRKPLT
jgi:myo-inositol-1(or 4)-monophosphatase